MHRLRRSRPVPVSGAPGDGGVPAPRSRRAALGCSRGLTGLTELSGEPGIEDRALQKITKINQIFIRRNLDGVDR